MPTAIPERPAKRLVGRVAPQMTASTTRFAKIIGKRHPCRKWVCFNFGLRPIAALPGWFPARKECAMGLNRSRGSGGEE